MSTASSQATRVADSSPKAHDPDALDSPLLEYSSDSSARADHMGYSDEDTSFQATSRSPPFMKESVVHESRGQEGSPAFQATPARKVSPAPRPTITTHGLHRDGTGEVKSPASSKGWYEFDLAVVVALVSPIGNWLTGGDHVRNLLLVILLLFYLHQIIEIPWTLYQRARPRRRVLSIPPSPTDSPQVKYAHLAATELRRLELFFLFLTLVSPLLGALLLRYGTESVLGAEAVSWFSTGLFVLATGMRPWRHLVSRLQERTTELHDFVHYPDESRDRMRLVEERRQQELDELRQRVGSLEKTLKRVREDVLEQSEEMVRHASGIVSSTRKQEKRWEKFDDKIQGMERIVQEIQANRILPPPGKSTDSWLPALSLFIQLKDLILGAIHMHRKPRRRSSILQKRRISGALADSASKDIQLDTIIEEDVGDLTGGSGEIKHRKRSSSSASHVSMKHPQSKRRSYFHYAYGFARPLVVLPLHTSIKMCRKAFAFLAFPVRVVARMASTAT